LTNKVLALLNRRSFLIAVFFGLALTLVAQSSFTTSAHGAIVGTGVKVPAGGGTKESAAQNCAADFAVVGVALTPVGSTTTPVSFGVFCRGIGSNGALLLSDQSTTSNTTKVGGGSGNTTLFCGPGKVVTGMSFVKWNNVGIRCATAPTLNENNLVIWMAAYSTGAQDTNCSTSELMSGFYTRTGALTDAIGAVCSPYVLNKITLNSNGATTGTALADLAQSSPGTPITLPNFTGTRTGFTFDGWNTLANGTGTDYAVGSSITPSAALTLFANWRSTITYNANNGGATATGSVPLPTIAKSSYAVTALAANSSPLAINGYTFSGWNSRADLTGTLYPVASFGPIVDRPYMHFDAKNFNDSTNAWLDDSGNNRSIPGTAITSVAAGTTPTNTVGAIRGDPKLIPNVSGTNGSLAAFPAVQGTTADGIVIGNADLSKFTFCYVARYAGSNRERIFTGTKENWVSGFIVNATDFFYHTTTAYGTYSASLGQVSGNLAWKVMCDSGGAPITVRSNGVLVGTSTIATIMPEMTINLSNSRINPTQTSDWAVAEMFIFDSILSDAKILQLEAQLKDKYQITAMTATPGTVNYAATGDTTLYAQWNSTITYDANGSTSGTVPAATIVKGIGATATLATNSGTLARTGYSFSGWSTQADGTGTNYAAGSSSYQTVGNTTLYAKWVRTISFNTNTATGTAPADILIVNSATTTITLPSEGNLLKTGFSFGGWSAIAGGAAETSPYATPASASTTLYAKWSANTYLVSYDTATATSGTMATSSYTAGTAAALRTNALARTGYSFDGWNTAANGTGTAYVNSSSLTIYNNLTLYPQWKLLAPGVPTVTVLAGNGEVTITATAVTASATVGPATSILVTAYSSGGGALSPAKTCTIYPPATTCVISGLTNGTAYQFAASATNTTNTSALSTKVNGTPTSYLVTYNATGNGGTSTTASAIFTKPTALVLPSATRAGFTFSGWYTLQSGGTLVGGSGSSYSPTSAVTLYANFTAIAYTISYDGNGSTGGNVPASHTYQQGADTDSNQIYSYTGANQTFVVPGDISGTQAIQVEIWGAGGGGSYFYYSFDTGGGAGGYTSTLISTPTIGESLTIKVGQGGVTKSTATTYGGGGVGTVSVGSSGGGYSGIFAGATPLAISGGGGGGAPGGGDIAAAKAGGGGGGNQNGTSSGNTGYSGGAGTTTAGGLKATCANATGTAGSAYTGGNGCAAGEGAGGGGGGYFGGGGGNSIGASNGGGGGGSGYLDSARTSSTTATVGALGTSGWALPDATSTNYGAVNAGRGGKPNIDVSADSSGGNGRIVISWKTKSGAYIISSTAPTKVGYTFNGWNTAANGSGTNIAAGSTYTTSANLSLFAHTTSANLSLFAQWTPVARTITYALAGGTSDTRTATLTGKFPGNSITLPIASAVNKTGYTFAGWSDGTTTYSGGAVWTVSASDSNFTFTAIWNIQLLSYRYDTNGGGTAPTSGTINYGSALTLAASNGLVKAGYNFTGWNDGTTTSNAGASVTINIDKVFVAQWSTITYSISYDANNGTGNTVSGSFIGGGVPYPIAINGFLRSGYRFTGWNTAANGSGTAYVVGSGYSTASDLVLYATWSANDYSVTYSGNGATSGTLPAVATFTTGQSFTVNSNAGNLVKTGYSFDGWNTAADGSGTNYAAAATTLTTTSNLTLYAKWLIKTLTITFSSGTGTASTQFPANTTAQYASLYTLPSSDTSTDIGGQQYVFTGWSDGSTTYAAGTAYRIGDSNLIFTAQWVAIYTVKYVLNGGSGAVPADVVRTDLYSETLTLVVPTKSGFTFNGWKDQTGSAVSGSSFTVSSTRYILSAQWVPAPRTLTFTNGGSGASGSQSSITGKVIGDIATLPSPDPSLSKTGYTFGGWSDGIATYPAGGTFVVGSSDVTFTALWISNAYVITYNGNGATAGTVPASGTYNPGSADYVVSANPVAPNTLVKAGYTFAGWNTAANGGGGDYVAGTGLLTTFIDRTLYAKWNPSEFSVSYDTDGGTLAPSAVNKFYGTSFTLPTAPTKTGSNFLGWETGSGASANLYPAGSNFVMISTAVLFKAKWSGIYYAVTYLLNGGSGTAPTQADVASGGNFNTAAAQSRAGFTFTGWNDGSSLISATTSITNITGNSTLTAQWTIALPGISAAPTVVPGEGNVRVTPAIPATGGTVSQFTVTASPGSATCTVTLPDTNCVITPLTNGTSYTFTTVATNSAGSSLASPASAAATPASVPSLPTGITGSGAGGTVNLAWMAPTDNGGSAITDYLLQYRVVGSGSWTTFSDGVSTNTTATVTGLSAATEYEFRVTAINIIGNSTPSFASTVFLSSAPPAIVSVVAADAMVTVTLSAPSNSGSSVISSYTITAYDAFNVAAGFCLPLPGALTCDVIGLTNGTAYTFKAIATTVIAGDNTDSLPSAASAAVTPARIASPPTNVVATISGANVNLSFTAPLSNGGAAITGYTATSDPGGITGTLSGATAGTITITGLASGSAYSFTVVATNSAGSSTASPPSLSVTLAAATAPDAPTIALVTTTNATSATISFTAPVSNGGSAITSYTATSDPGGITGTVTGSGSGTITVNGLTTGTAYVFTVVATNNVGSSTPSGQSLAVTPVTPSAPISTCDSACQVALAAATAQAAAQAIAVNTAADKLVADQIVSDKAAADKLIADKAAADKLIADRAAADKIITDKAAADKLITDRAAADKIIADGAAADKLIADKAAADKLIADRAAADKLIADKAAADRALAEVSAKLKADAIAAALATKTAIENATVVTAVKIIADTAIVEAAATVTAAAVAQVVADKASADAITAAKKDAVTVVAKAITTKAARTAVADAVAAIKAAADIAAKLAIKNQSVPPKTSTQVDIAINALKPNVSSAQLIAQANAVAAAAKTAANAAAQTALKQAAAVKATASQAQKLAAETAAKISSEQKSASAAAILAKSAAESVVKALEIKIATAGVAKAAVSELAKKLEKQLTLVDQAAKATDVTVRLELEKKISESAIAISEQEKIVTSANSNADEAAVKQETAAKAAASAKALADQQSKVAANMKLIAIEQSKIANKALADAAVANLVATAAVAAAAKVPAKAVIAAQPPPVKNSTTATITGLKPGQKLKVTINVKPVK
jgi:uncharacterized repeat protein (TIGR02543 family)